MVCADIPLPEGVQPAAEEQDELADASPQRNKKPEKWTELGLNTVR